MTTSAFEQEEDMRKRATVSLTPIALRDLCSSTTKQIKLRIRWRCSLLLDLAPQVFMVLVTFRSYGRTGGNVVRLKDAGLKYFLLGDRWLTKHHSCFRCWMVRSSLMNTLASSWKETCMAMLHETSKSQAFCLALFLILWRIQNRKCQ